MANQKTPNGYYNIEKMLKFSANKGATIGVCGSCMEARGLQKENLMEGAKKGTLAELAEWVLEADKVLTF
jgi:uncharacterized protein involved in oxidation of intracellular sulfur